MAQSQVNGAVGAQPMVNVWKQSNAALGVELGDHKMCKNSLAILLRGKGTRKIQQLTSWHCFPILSRTR